MISLHLPAGLNIFLIISNASSPLILMIPIPELFIAVEMAAIVSVFIRFSDPAAIEKGRRLFFSKLIAKTGFIITRFRHVTNPIGNSEIFVMKAFFCLYYPPSALPAGGYLTKMLDSLSSYRPPLALSAGGSFAKMLDSLSSYRPPLALPAGGNPTKMLNFLSSYRPLPALLPAKHLYLSNTQILFFKKPVARRFVLH